MKWKVVFSSERLKLTRVVSRLFLMFLIVQFPRQFFSVCISVNKSWEKIRFGGYRTTKLAKAFWIA